MLPCEQVYKERLEWTRLERGERGEEGGRERERERESKREREREREKEKERKRQDRITQE